METSKKWKIENLVIIICFAIALIAGLFWVRSLSKKLAYQEFENQRLSDRISNLDSQVSSLRADLNHMIHEMDSLVEELNYSIIGTGTKPNTAAYRLTLTPKELAEDTTVEITVGDTTVPFTRKGNTFTGTVDVPLFEENENYPILTVTSAGITKRDELEEISLFHAYKYYLPYLSQNGSSTGTNYEDPEKTDVTISYSFHLNAFATGVPVTFTKVTLSKAINGKEVSNQDVTNSLDDAGNYDEYDIAFTLNNADQMILTIRAEDSLGYIHELETHLQCDQGAEGSHTEFIHEFQRIYAPDGTMLFATPYAEFP